MAGNRIIQLPVTSKDLNQHGLVFRVGEQGKERQHYGLKITRRALLPNGQAQFAGQPLGITNFPRLIIRRHLSDRIISAHGCPGVG